MTKDYLFVKPVFSREGMRFAPSSTPVQAWLERPEASTVDPALAALLSQLQDDGFARIEGDAVVLDWDAAYRLIADPDYRHADVLLGLPPVVDLRPKLVSKGSLADRSFMISLSGWCNPKGTPLSTQPQLTGPVVSSGGIDGLLPPESWAVLAELARFHARPIAERTHESNQQHWSQLRQVAVAAGAELSDFLKKTIVLTPEHLAIQLNRVTVGDSPVIEVSPTFEDAPPRWLEIFDRLGNVPDHYDIPDGSSLTQVLITPEVRSVLTEVKRMPGRRVAGERAEAFVRNPFAILGAHASRVIDPEAFESEREKAGIRIETFQPFIIRDEGGQIIAVDLKIDCDAAENAESAVERLDTPRMLDDFVSRLRERLKREAQCLRWRGHELELLGDAALHLEAMQKALDEWLAPEMIEAADVLDASRYSDRIEGFGDEEQYASPFIARKNEDEGWFPENLEIAIVWPPSAADGADAAGTPQTMTPERIADFERAIANARQKLSPTVKVPESGYEMPILKAEALLGGIVSATEKIRRAPRGKPFVTAPGEKTKRIHLKLKSNIDQVDYEEKREDRLRLPDGTAASLPSSLRPEVSLRAHQLAGVAWLQNLWGHSPTQCRGALLADDMGLGKTIQLLTFIARCLEDQPDLEPVLVVAPVALLENWREEIDKFFRPGSMPATLLYGETLAQLRVPQAAIDEQLRQNGLTRLLRKDWRANARIVLTTYETLRDLEFSLAAERWSIMVCDEAQKIKNPNAMVTRAAKKQNVRFKIACTGTPVENTLTDLWCLFDFIQPGFLGSLSEFGQLYRRPIEAETDDDKERIEELRAKISLQLLRRTKAEVAKDLPAKLERCHKLGISEMQLRHYGRVMAELKKAEGGRKHLEMIQVLRRVISDPFAFDVAEAERAPVEQILDHNPKMRWLIDVLREIRGRQEKVIVFCEFRDLQRMIQRCIGRLLDVHADIVNGDTSASASDANSRQKRIRRFQEAPGFGVIVLSPLAVGFGVNIQAANHVIHFSRTWNPAKEDQATDRAYRIGQTRDVHVHYPIVSASNFKTFDEKLHELLTWKRSLSDDMLNGTGELRAADFGDIDELMTERMAAQAS